MHHHVLSEGNLAEPHVVRVSKLRFIREIQSLYWLIKNTGKTTPILTGTWYPEAFLSLLAFRKNIYVLAHGTEVLPAQNPIKELFWKHLRKWVLSKATLCIANSEFTKQLVLKSAPEANATSLPLAVDSQKFRILSSEQSADPCFVIGTVSRLHAYKGFDTVLRAMAELPEEKRKGIRYKIVGSGPYKVNLMQQILEMNLQNQVEFVGSLDEEGLVKFYNSIDLFVMCSRLSMKTQDVEGFGLVYLEAQACGTPVIATRSGGIPDAVTDKEGGWLIEENDDRALSTKLLELMQKPELLKLAGQQARERVENKYQWSDYILKLIKLMGLKQ